MWYNYSIVIDAGPTNIRVEKPTHNGVRLLWDLPMTASCYGRTDIDVVVYLGPGQTRVIRLNKEQSYVDIVGLQANTDYRVALKVGYDGTELASLPYTFQTGDLCVSACFNGSIMFMSNVNTLSLKL